MESLLSWLYFLFSYKNVSSLYKFGFKWVFCNKKICVLSLFFTAASGNPVSFQYYCVCICYDVHEQQTVQHILYCYTAQAEKNATVIVCSKFVFKVCHSTSGMKICKSLMIVDKISIYKGWDVFTVVVDDAVPASYSRLCVGPVW